MVKSYTQLIAQRYKDNLDDEANEFMQYTVTGVNRMEKIYPGYALLFPGGGRRPRHRSLFPCRLAFDWALLELQPLIDETTPPYPPTNCL